MGRSAGFSYTVSANAAPLRTITCSPLLLNALRLLVAGEVTDRAVSIPVYPLLGDGEAHKIAAGIVDRLKANQPE